MNADIFATHFKDADKAREYLEALRWPDGPICPHCGCIGDHYALKGGSHRPGLWKCKDCRKQFSVTVGTIFERSKIPLNKWLMAVHLMCASKKAISSRQIHRMLGVTYKSAWFMTHRIREAMVSGNTGLLGTGGGTGEVDETYWGNNGKQHKGASGYQHKMKVVALEHLQRYCTEFDFRWNHRKTTDVQRSESLLRRVGGKRLTYTHT